MVYIILQLRKQLATLWRNLMRLELPISRPSQELGLSYGTYCRILHLDLHLHSYKVQLKQQLKPAKHLQRRRYVEWMLEQQLVNGNFSNKILFSDEAYFTLVVMLIHKIKKLKWGHYIQKKCGTGIRHLLLWNHFFFSVQLKVSY